MPIAATTDPAATKSRLMDVAERLFAEKGFDAVSLRRITAEAEANLAAVNYHFGSKDALVIAVVRRWLKPLNKKRLRLLLKFEAESGHRGESPDVALIAEAFVRPALELYRESDQSKRVFFRLMGRCMLETRKEISDVLVEEFREVVEAFGAAFRRSLPHLTARDVTMRMMFMAGAMAHTILSIDKLAAFDGKPAVTPSADDLIRQIVDFVASGFPGVAGKEDK